MSNEMRLTRVQVDLDATYYLQGIEAKGRIIDISAGGIAMEVKQLIVEKDVIRVKFTTTDGTIIDFWGIVLNVNGFTIGIKYEEISNENREHVDDFINDLLRSRGLAARERY